jgi:hypothetical protein
VGCQKDPIYAPDPALSSTVGGTASSISERIYLDLTKDQMVPGGITNKMLQDYLNQGYILQSLAADQFARVQFKNSNGNIYYKNGWLKKGKKYLIRTQFEPPIHRMCGHDFWPEDD